MWGAATLLVASAGCSPRTLVLVDPCPNGGVTICLGLSDASGPFDSSDASDLSIPSDVASDVPPMTTLLQGLVGLWHLDGNAMDSSGNGNNGTLVGLDPASAWVPGGRLSGALAINSQGYVLVPLSRSIASIVTGVTISAWAYSDGTVFDYGTALSRQIGNTLQQYYHLSLKEPAGDPSLFITTTLNTVATQILQSVPVSPRVWTHLVGTYDGKAATLYVDGTLVASFPFAMGNFTYVLADGSPDTTPIILGGNANMQPVTELFPGRIDEIALYNRALNTSEILQLYNAVIF